MRLLRLFTTINDTICDMEGVDRVLVVDVTCSRDDKYVHLLVNVENIA
jgi:hypothetical protein